MSAASQPSRDADADRRWYDPFGVRRRQAGLWAMRPRAEVEAAIRAELRVVAVVSAILFLTLFVAWGSAQSGKVYLAAAACLFVYWWRSKIAWGAYDLWRREHPDGPPEVP